MSKAKWKFTAAEIKRAVEGVRRSGLPVSAVRVSDDAIYIETRATEASTKITDADEWKA